MRKTLNLLSDYRTELTEIQRNFLEVTPDLKFIQEDDGFYVMMDMHDEPEFLGETFESVLDLLKANVVPETDIATITTEKGIVTISCNIYTKLLTGTYPDGTTEILDENAGSFDDAVETLKELYSDEIWNLEIL